MMSTITNKRTLSVTRLLTFALCIVVLTGCGENLVYKRSVADLNQKAQQFLSQGDSGQAISRLEAAYDLDPTEPITLNNLAVAYLSHGDFEKALQAYDQLLAKHAGDKADIMKNMGVAYEGKADMANQKLQEIGLSLEDPKVTAAQKTEGLAAMEQLKAQIETDYGNAIKAYQQAIAAGYKDAKALEHQQTNLEAAIKRLNDPTQPTLQ